MNRVCMAGMVALLVAATCGMAQDQAPAGGPGAGRMGMGGPRRAMEMEGQVLRWLAYDPQAAKDLVLSDEQIKTIRTNLFELKKSMIDLNAKMELAAVNQAELMSDENLNEDAVLKAVEETGRLRTDIAKLNIQHMLAVRKILTPEQRKKLKEMNQQRAQTWRENRPAHPMPGGRPVPRDGKAGEPPKSPQAPAAPPVQ